MAPNNDYAWKRGKFPSFKTDFDGLNPHQKWTVVKTIEGMLRSNDPTKTYESIECDNCLPGMNLFGILDDGFGNKGLALQVHINEQDKILTPISVKVVSPK